MLQQSLTLGRIGTVPLRIHWSWLIVVVLITLMLNSVYVLPACAALSPCAASWVMAITMTALLNLSVVLHELGHALVALRYKLPVVGITLFAFGGMVEVRSESPGPAQELAIAIAGPAVSLLLALSAGVLWWSLERLDLLALELLALLASHVAISNAILGLFNLLPGFPMDGGRVLRAALWFFDDELMPATRTVTLIGRGMGLAMVIVGFIAAPLSGNPMLGLWLAIIGCFLIGTANSSYRQLIVHSALHGVQVDALMQRRFRTAPVTMPLDQFVTTYILGGAELGYAVVPANAEEDEPPALGLITLRQTRRLRHTEWAARQVGDVMLPQHDLPQITPQMSAIDALYHMNTLREDVIPVLDNQRLVGVLRRHDIAVFVQMRRTRKRS